MSNTFLSKVVAERAALVIVNRAFPGEAQLPGLSLAAIDQWRGKLALPSTHRLVQLLKRLGEVVQTLSNRSNESFSPLAPDLKTAIEQLMEEIKITVDDLRHP